MTMGKTKNKQGVAMEKNTMCGITNTPYYIKIENAEKRAIKYLDKADNYWNGGDCNKADFKRANEMLNISYEALVDALRQDLLKARMEERNTSEWNELYWKAPHYVHQFNDECKRLYNDAWYGRYVEDILYLKDRKSNWKSIMGGK